MKLTISVLGAMPSLSSGLEVEGFSYQRMREFEPNACGIWQDIQYCETEFVYRHPCPDDMSADRKTLSADGFKSGWDGESCGYMLKVPGADDSTRWFWDNWKIGYDDCLYDWLKAKGSCPAATLICQ